MKASNYPLKGGDSILRFVMSRVKLVLTLLVLIFTFNALSAYNLYVNAAANPQYANGSPQHPYVHIQDAIDHAFDDNNIDNASGPNVCVIVMGNEDYRESLVVNFRNVNGDSHLVQHLTLRSDADNNSQFRLRIPDHSTTAIDVIGDNDAVFVIDGILIEPISSDTESIGLNVVTSPLLRLEVRNCYFSGLWTSLNLDIDDQFPMGEIIIDSSRFEVSNNPDSSIGFVIKGYYACGSLTINNNTVDHLGTNENLNTSHIHANNICITNNIFHLLEVGIGGFMPTFSTAVVDGNIFNKSTLCMWQRINSQVKNNLFQYDMPDSSPPSAIIMMNDNSTSLAEHKISNNIFMDVQNVLLFQSSSQINHRVDASIANNSFLQCGSIVKMYFNDNDNANAASDRISVFRNNLFVGESSNPFIIQDTSGEPFVLIGENRIPVAYSHFTTPLAENSSLDLDADTVVYGDPMIYIDDTDGSYELVWNETVKSPLINAGCPETDGVIQTDPDGTPPDIGAVYYPHHHMEYFPINAQQNPSGIYWLSFPVVDDRTYENGVYWNELGYMFGSHMQYAPSSQLELIDWSYDEDKGPMYYNDDLSHWQNPEHRVTQAMGYKIKFAPGAPVDPVIVNGFRADPLNTPIKWVVSVEENGQMQPFANRIGYFMPYTIRAGDALSAYLPGSTRYRYLDYVHTIKTQTWSTYRVSEELGSPWVIDPNSYTFSEGDMVELLLIPEAPEEMYWSGFSTPPVPPVVRPQTEAFEYEEKLDYITIFISFDPEDMPDELGLFVDGECRGAAVVDSSLIDVCLYPGSATGDSELEIVFHYASKGKKVAKGWQAYNHASMLFEERNLHPGDLGRFGYISFSEQAGESLVPLQTLLMQNYPNPFNPTTNISFVLAEQGSARMDVYNLRGQRVRTLFNTEFSKGRHTIEWDGRDDQERQLASGIYFYRLTTPQSMYSKKMILMK